MRALKGFGWWPLAGAVVLAALGCHDSVGPEPRRCVRDCVSEMSIAPWTTIVRPGDVVPFKANLTILGTVRPGVRWTATPPSVMTIDTAGVATITGLGLANVFATPLGDSTAFSYAVVWSVRGDTSVYPILGGFGLLPASLDPAAIPDSMAFDLSFLIGTNETSLPARVEIVATGPKDTVVSVPVAATPGVPQRLRIVVRRAATGVAGLPRGSYQFHTRLAFADGHVAEYPSLYFPTFIP